MIVTCVTVYVKEAHVKDFIAATVRNHEGSVKEPGNLRFDVLRSRTDPTRFMLYEAYESDAAAKAHKDTGHYRAWRETVEPWMARPREGAPHDVIRPEGTEGWR